MQLVRVPEDGVPRAGVVRVGLVRVLFVNVSVEDVVTILTPSIVTTPAPLLAMVVSVACPSSIVPTPNAVDVDAVRPDIGNPVQLVRVPEDGVPNAGVVRVGLVRVLFVNVSVVALPTRVSVASGRVNVLLAVGSTTVNVVSYIFDVAPSNIKFTAVLAANASVLLPRRKSPPSMFTKPKAASVPSILIAGKEPPVRSAS